MTTLKQDPCSETIKNREEIKDLNKTLRINIKDCDEKMYGDFIKKYFKNIDDSPLTHKGLLSGLFNYYKKEKKDPNFSLTFQQFIDKFSRDQASGGSNFKKQHVFEALCRLLLLYNFDKKQFGKDKTFFSSLEDLLKHEDAIITKQQILDSYVNESSKGGIVDILFTTDVIENDKTDDKSACEFIYRESQSASKKSETAGKKLIMIQNKYFDKEKTNINSYDVTRIHALAGNEAMERIKKRTGDHEIVLMVNNKEALSANLSKSKQQYTDLNLKIYGVLEIDEWFQSLLYKIFHSDTVEALKPSTVTEMSELKPRFHQSLITHSTMRYNEGEQKIKKFIWGAVPRSGKTYMIGDLIIKRNTNDIVIILGAKTETEEQFCEMFNKFDDFSDFSIITPTKQLIKGKKKIYLLSQEWFKSNKIDKIKLKFKDDVKAKFKQLFIKGKKIDLFFDEIHKGGSTDNSSDILQSFINDDIKIDIFVMVTATFAKPTLRYDNFMEGSSKLIEWSYNDQQSMKQVTNETKKNMMINSRSTDIEKTVMEELFYDYHVRYGEQYLSVISSEYEKYPELVLITPQLIAPNDSLFSETNDVRHIFGNNLKCDACKSVVKEPPDFYRDPKNIFEKEGPVSDLLTYIGVNIYNELANEKTFNFPIGSPHTQLWFLPDKNLYSKTTSCDNICKEIKSEHHIEEDVEEHLKSSDTKNIPNIEPLTRGLAYKIIKHPSFSRYNVFIVHNTDLKYFLGKDSKDFYNDGTDRIRLYNNKSPLKQQIREYEKDTYKKRNQLIILTGAKMRLGISLPCADIAFNFDNIASIDNNYQTMFRVLTERETPMLKKYGYYLDFNMGRSIDFLYQYSSVYGEKTGNKTLKESVEYLQTLLFSFNYNGLNLATQNSKKEIGLYNKLIADLKLGEPEYVDYWSKGDNLKVLIKKSLNQSINKARLNEILGDYLKIHKHKDTIAFKKKLRDGSASKIMPTRAGEEEQEEQEEQEESLVEEEEKPLDLDKIIELLSLFIPSIVSLLALFSQQKGYECDSLSVCLDKSIEQILALEELCKCGNTDASNIIDCFLNSPENINIIEFDHKKYKARLLGILNFLKKELESNQRLNDALNINFKKIIHSMKNEKGPLILKLKSSEIKQLIEDNLMIKTEEKNKYGEVFTPVDLIDEMLDKLPKEVWRNHTLKWLDPANGIGNFPMIVYERLMEGLKKWQPNEPKRRKHIIEHMLYMVELNPKNVKISRKIFGDNANIFCGSFLDVDWKVRFPDKFDVIMGNPPFNAERTGEKGTNAGRSTIWDIFIIRSMDILTPNGYLTFINPPNWRGLGPGYHKIWDLLTKKQILYLHIYGKSGGKKHFNVGSRFDVYLVQNKPTFGKTNIIDEIGEKHKIRLDTLHFLPNYSYDLILPLLTEHGIDVLYGTNHHTSKHLKNTSTDKIGDYKYPVIHSINKDGIVPLMWANDNTKGHFGVPKVILNFNEHQYSHPEQNDWKGKYGMSQISFGIPITNKEEGDMILRAIETEAFKTIINATKWGAFQTDYRMFKYFKKDFWKTLLSNNSFKSPHIKTNTSIKSPHSEGSSNNSSTNGSNRRSKKYRPTDSNSKSTLSTKSIKTLSESLFSSVRGEEEMKDDGYIGEPIGKSLKTSSNKSKTKKKKPKLIMVCKKTLGTRKSCEKRNEKGPMDKECELSEKNRCKYKKSLSKKLMKGVKSKKMTRNKN